MAASSPYQSASLYVGDLNATVTEALLFEIFKAVGPVASIRVCRDAVTRRSLGYAYVNFHNVVDAERALDTLNYTLIKGRPCRIMWSHRDPSVRRSGQGNVFIKNLDKSIDNKALYDTFSAFGNILSCKVVTDPKGNSKGYGFVHYETKEAADGAINKVNGMLLNGKIVYVGPFIPKKERIPGTDPDKFTNIYIKNLPANFTEDDLRRDFGAFGAIQSAVIIKDTKDTARAFGFVNYNEHENAQKAVDEMNGKTIGDREVFVGRAQKKTERDLFLKKLREERAQKYQGINLYVKNLDDSVTDEKLAEAFAPFGSVSSCKVMADDKGNTRGFGFVCFDSADEASKAVNELNGSMLSGKPIYVALAERKEVRRAKLEAQHAARAAARMAAGGPALAGAPVYPGAPAVFYPSQAPQTQRQGGFVGYPPQGMPVRRWPTPPGGAPAGPHPAGRQGPYQMPPNTYMPVPVPRGQHPRQGAPRGAPPAGPGAPIPQQGNGRNFKYTQNVRNQQGAPQQGAPAGHVPAGVPKAGPAEVQALSASVLALATPEERKNMLGEHLFPLIEAVDPVNGPKITGMLIDSMEVGELLHLLQSPEALQDKIGEALEVLKNHAETEGEGGDLANGVEGVEAGEQ
jgi:polyadenylate-binding protein